MVPTPPAQRCWALTCELNKTAWPFKKGRGRLWEGQRMGKETMSKNNAEGSPACSSLKVPAVVVTPFCPSSPLPFPCWCYLPHTHIHTHTCTHARERGGFPAESSNPAYPWTCSTKAASSSPLHHSRQLAGPCPTVANVMPLAILGEVWCDFLCLSGSLST